MPGINLQNSSES